MNTSTRFISRAAHALAALGAFAAVVAALPTQAAPLTPNDRLFATQQWWLGSRLASASAGAGIPDMAQAWSRSTGTPTSGAGVVIAVLDTGITNHPDLDAHLVLPGYDFVSQVAYAHDGDGRDANPTDPGDRLTQAEIDANLALWDGCSPSISDKSSWHGTFVAGQLAAVTNNLEGMAGINWQGRVLPVRVAGRCGAQAQDVMDAMRWAAGLPVAGAPTNANPARIVLIGFAGTKACDPGHPDAQVAAIARQYIDTVAELRRNGVLVVAASGNDRSAVGRPANCPGVLAVTALNQQGFKANYANFGPQIALSTVGGDTQRGATCDTELADTGIASLSNAGTDTLGSPAYAAGGGTSYASPLVAGTASLMWAINPSLTVDQIDAGLRASARPHAQVPALGVCSNTGNRGRCQCSTSTCGAGILDADQALAFAENPAGYAAPPLAAVVLDSPAIRLCATKLGLPAVPASGASAASAGASAVLGAEGSGGGAVSLWWITGLACGVLALAGLRRRSAT